MHGGLYLATAAVIAVLASTGCVSKSANPLSPSIAGPIPGVEISTPQTIQPAGGKKIPFDQQPVTLTVNNVSTSGVRPLSYLFEMATDPNFGRLVLSRAGVAPGASGQTSLRLTDPLEIGRVYYWRVRGQDGANTGPYSAPANFSIYTPVVLSAPGPISPIDNVAVDSLRPRFSFTNAQREGPAGAVIYTIETSETSSFANAVSVAVAEQAGQTSLDSPQDLPAGKQIFWRVRASDPTTVGPWSTIQVFKTPGAPAGGGGGVFSPDDGLDLGSVIIQKGPGSITGWTVGSRITQVRQGPENSGELCIWHDQLGRWPSVIFFNDPNTLVEGNQWVFANIGGQWYGGAADWYRPGQACKGVDASSIGRDAFDQEPLHSWVPQPGELFGVMSSTPARAWPDMRTLDQRTNIVLLHWQ